MNGNRLIAAVAWALAASLGCASPERTAVLIPDGSPSFALMDFDAPPSTQKLDSMTRPEARNSQNETMLSFGNAMSCVPIWIGIR